MFRSKQPTWGWQLRVSSREGGDLSPVNTPHCQLLQGFLFHTVLPLPVPQLDNEPKALYPSCHNGLGAILSLSKPNQTSCTDKAVSPMRLRKLSHQEKAIYFKYLQTIQIWCHNYKLLLLGSQNPVLWVLRKTSVSSCPRTAETRPANTKTHSHNLHNNLSSLALPQEARCSLHFCKFPTIFLAARF